VKVEQVVKDDSKVEIDCLHSYGRDLETCGVKM